MPLITRLSKYLLVVLLIGCAGYLVATATYYDFNNQQERAETHLTLENGHSIGQTFTTDYDDLSGILFSVNLLDPRDEAGVIRARLRRSPQDSQDIAIAEIPISSLDSTSWMTFSFPAQAGSKGGQYFLSLESSSEYSGNYTIGASEDDAYSVGALYTDGKVSSGDLAFRLIYTPSPFQLLSTAVAERDRVFDLLALTFFFAMNGWALLLATGLDRRFSIVEQFVLALLCGVAFPQWLVTLVSLIGVRIDSPWLWGGTLILWVAGGFRLVIRIWRKSPKMDDPDKPTPEGTCVSLAFAGFFLLALLVRAVQIHDIAAPLWVDGLLHQSFLENLMVAGGVPADQIYHIGFHQDVAYLDWLGDFALPESILVFGQWISLLAGASVYLLAKRLIKDPIAALASALVLWFLAPMPAYFITWSRYPLLTGLVLLPGVAVASLDAIERWDWRSYLLLTYLVVSLLLSHYGAFVFWLTFVVVSLMGRWGIKRDRPRNWLPYLRRGKLIAVLLLFGLLSAFLGVRLASLFNTGQVTGILEQGRAMALVNDDTYMLQLTLQHGGLLVWAAGLFGALVAVIRREKAILFGVVGWFALQSILTWLQMISIGSALANTTNLILASSLPLALLAGYWVYWLKGLWPALSVRVVVAFMILISLTGGYNLAAVVNPQTVLFTPADDAAMRWIERNVPSNEAFLGDVFFWGNISYRPADGGGWIQAMTGRRAVFPSRPVDLIDPITFMDQNDLRYVYLGQRGGQLDSLFFSNQPGQFRLVYSEDGVKIYQYTNS